MKNSHITVIFLLMSNQCDCITESVSLTQEPNESDSWMNHSLFCELDQLIHLKDLTQNNDLLMNHTVHCYCASLMKLTWISRFSAHNLNSVNKLLMFGKVLLALLKKSDR